MYAVLFIACGSVVLYTSSLVVYVGKILFMLSSIFFFFFQAEDGIRDLVRSRGLGDVYKRQDQLGVEMNLFRFVKSIGLTPLVCGNIKGLQDPYRCLLYTSDAADERSSVDLGGRRIIKKKNRNRARDYHGTNTTT